MSKRCIFCNSKYIVEYIGKIQYSEMIYLNKTIKDTWLQFGNEEVEFELCLECGRIQTHTEIKPQCVSNQEFQDILRLKSLDHNIPICDVCNMYFKKYYFKCTWCYIKYSINDIIKFFKEEN